MVVWNWINYGILPILARIALSVTLANMFLNSDFGGKARTFLKHADDTARSMSNPQIVFWSRSNTGEPIKVSDYLDGYHWVRDNTPEDSRVIAWWDYGYQITGIARRTSLADGNTWNHEHIATIGLLLTSNEKKAWQAIRHLADYVLVWAGGSGDDLGKSTHLARIGNSIFPFHCGDHDPKCEAFGFYAQGKPTPMMEKSLLYKLCQNNVSPGVRVNPEYFEEVHKTKYGKLRVYRVKNVSQSSKKWIADPANRDCDAPGSWYCTGNYPPALKKLISKRRDFSQIGDFNRAGGVKSAYQRRIEQEVGSEL
jgi:dolichyl-diphosphooligosaccharide--protein glycosyltransferase